MRVLIAPQEFKGTLNAIEAAEAIAEGVRQAHPDWQLDLVPMADGGPGTLDALLTAVGGERRRDPVMDPLLRPISADWGILAEGQAVVECASASGLWRLAEVERDAKLTSSFGTGQLISRAISQGSQRLLVGLGGSATNDAGAGMAAALGFSLLDRDGARIQPGGAALRNLARVVPPANLQALSSLEVIGATDVTNPLLGPEGASSVFAPQKGASPSDITVLEEGLAQFADILVRDLGIDMRALPGSGAAGGLGAGLLAFLEAELVSGAALVGEAARLPQRVEMAGLVLTGEGRLDGQSLAGKASVHVARLARQSGTKVACLAGSLGPGSDRAREEFTLVAACIDQGARPPAGKDAAPALASLAAQVVAALI